MVGRHCMGALSYWPEAPRPGDADPDLDWFEALIPQLDERFGAENLLVNHSAKDPHRLEKKRVLVRHFDGSLQPMAEASDFIRHMSRIDSFRVYASPDLRQEVAEEVGRLWQPST